MATFSYNLKSSDSSIKQYKDYLENQNYVNQIDRAIRETGEMKAAVVTIQSREIQNAIDVSSQRHSEAIIESREAICSSLESGFTDLNNSLYDIQGEINGLSNLVGHGFSLFVEGQKITHKYLGQIQNLLRLPDSQKERVYYIEEGMKYLHNAFKHGPDSDFYTDALNAFNASKGIQKKAVKDFISLYYIGLIHLKSTKHLDLPKAESYFRSSARYYLAEHAVGGTNFSKNLFNSNKTFLLGAAEAYLFAADACYIQQKFSEAVELAAEAWKTLPEMVKAGFMQSKYLAANNQSIEAAKVLEKVIQQNRFFSMEVLPDLDLISKPEITNLLERLRIEAIQEAKSKFDLCSQIILPNSIATSYLLSIGKLIELKKFLEAKKATDLLLVSKKWTLSAGANITNQGQVIAKISSQEFTGSLIEFVKFEKERVLALPKANNLIRIEAIERQKQSIQTEINNLQSQVDSNSYKLSNHWKSWLIFFGIVAVAAIISIALSRTHDSHPMLASLMALISFLVVFGGGAFAAIYLIVVIVLSISNVSKNVSLNSKISSSQQEISGLNSDIKELQ